MNAEWAEPQDYVAKRDVRVVGKDPLRLHRVMNLYMYGLDRRMEALEMAGVSALRSIEWKLKT